MQKFHPHNHRALRNVGAVRRASIHYKPDLMDRKKIHRLVHIVESLRRNGNCDETNGAVSHTCKMIHVVQMFENVTTQTRDDAQGNWHNPVHDMLRGSTALDKLRYMAVADVAAREFSQLQKELLSSMPVTKQLLRIPVPRRVLCR